MAFVVALKGVNNSVWDFREIEVKPDPGPLATLGSTAGNCSPRRLVPGVPPPGESDPAEMAARYGARTTVLVEAAKRDPEIQLAGLGDVVH